MKKQLFLLSLGLLFAGQFALADNKDCCDSSSSTSSSSCCKKVDVDTCKPCGFAHGKTFRSAANVFQTATPVVDGMFSSNVVRNLEAEDKHGGFEFVVFGGKNTKQSDSACYYFPYGHRQYNVSGEVTPQNFTTALATTTVSGDAGSGLALTDQGDGSPFWGGTAASTAEVDPMTLKFDCNKDTSIIRPWNFGITFAALFQPQGVQSSGDPLGAGLVTNPEFKSTLTPTHHYSHVGAGMKVRYHFSDDKQGFWGSLSTSVENVKSRICLNEDVQTAKTAITDYPDDGCDQTAGGGVAQGQPDQFGSLSAPPQAVSGTNATSTLAGAGCVKTSWSNQGFPDGDSPANMTQAFEQDAWNYGKIGCEQSVTRLADIELNVGYQWLCSDCAATSAYVGLVIPTGNKPCAEYVAPAVVGNGQHAGIMAGSTLELLLSENESRSIWYRMDTNGRYLFRNTQKRSFDLKGKEWSRYMMVWENEDAYVTAQNNIITTGTNENTANARTFTPGINVFTHDMKVKPRFQGRTNHAFYMVGECFRGEMGWNVLARTKECVEFACPWDSKPALASANYAVGGGLNSQRTIYNDSTTTEVSVSPSNTIFSSLGAFPDSDGFANSDQNYNSTFSAAYAKHALTEDDVNLDSACTPCGIIHTPYLTLGWSWDSECKPVVSVGASYEFGASNTSVSQWMLWGKFEMSF